MEEYFKRDLTEAEETRLAEILHASPDEALRFAQGMAAHYLELGLPEPVWPEKPMAYPDTLVKPVKHFPWLGMSVFLLILILLGLIKLNTVKESLPVSAPVPHPKALLKKNPLAVHREAPPAPFLPPAAPPSRYEELSVTVEMPQSALATVKVFDQTGNVVRTLFAGILPSGRQTFIWDGKTTQGLNSAPGLYTLEVRSGQNLMKKQIRLQP